MRGLRVIGGWFVRAAHHARAEAATIIAVTGCAVTSVGVGMVHVAAGVITGGVLLTAVGVVMARGEGV